MTDNLTPYFNFLKENQTQMNDKLEKDIYNTYDVYLYYTQRASILEYKED